MAQFKCLVSGTIVNFEHEHDIVEMRRHPQYEFVEPKPVKAENLVKEKTVVVKPLSKD